MTRDPLPSLSLLIGANVVAAVANAIAAYMNYRLGGWHMILVACNAGVLTMNLFASALLWRGR
jgi:hypothetical protein